ncbi:beta-succinyl synthetase precursor [Fusarium circinatum]|uniref:Beta-succinyl synthetase n=1 Tax=Fusarium circinatum TaxID=48490 RepID=A0A8H5SYV1_FUSCI|nr:beta-succinyl synthetase precursor [Fusarium circinatum]
MLSKIYKRGAPSSIRAATRSTKPQGARAFSIQEHAAQSILSENGVNVPRGRVAITPQQVMSAIDYLGGSGVLKAQILAGGRGKGTFDNGHEGGVHKVNSSLNAKELADRMLGHRLRTKQTSERGLVVNKVYVTEQVKYEKEFYLSFAVDRTQSKPAIVVSRSGGMNVEEAAEKDPGSIIKLHLSYDKDITRNDANAIAKVLGLASKRSIEQLHTMVSRLYTIFRAKDATLLEINPVPELAQFKGEGEGEGEDKDPRQAFAASHGFAYVSLDGTIGNIANCAGLAMATMDAIACYGGTCANFLDAGGKATKDTMVNAHRLVLSDERVKVLFINIYGGIIRGPVVAEALIDALKEISKSKIPLVVRLEGTDSAEGRKILEGSGLPIHSISDFSEAVQKAVALSRT